jgi:hypothetical protein
MKAIAPSLEVMEGVFLHSCEGVSLVLEGREGTDRVRGEVITAIGAVEALWQDNYLGTRFGSFMYLFSSMYEVRRLVGSCSGTFFSWCSRMGWIRRTRCKLRQSNLNGLLQ